MVLVTFKDNKLNYAYQRVDGLPGSRVAVLPGKRLTGHRVGLKGRRIDGSTG